MQINTFSDAVLAISKSIDERDFGLLGHVEERVAQWLQTGDEAAALFALIASAYTAIEALEELDNQ